MKAVALTVTVLLAAAPALAEELDFHLAYHVERSPATQLDLITCATIAEAAGKAAGYRVAVADYPGQLATVSGGKTNTGTFVVQCIAVETTTVTVVQGIDYRPSRGEMGRFADAAHAQIMQARK